MELFDLLFDISACIRLELVVIEDLGPRSPLVVACKVFLKEVPDLESSNGPLRISKRFSPVLKVDAHFFDDFDTIFSNLAELEGLRAGRTCFNTWLFGLAFSN